MIRIPDYRGVVALLTAIAVVVEQLWPGTHYAVIVSAVMGALLVHAGQPPADPPALPVPPVPAQAAP